ncbi:MAG: hypothetical protein ACFFDP_11015 [Promethearchaeota archaeon]
MRESTGAVLRLVFQFFLAIGQFLVVIGILQYVVNNNLDIVTNSLVYPLVGFLFFLVVHGIWRIYDNIITWRVSAGKT